MKNSLLKFREALEINDCQNYLNLRKTTDFYWFHMHGYFVTCTCQCLGLFDYMYYDSCISMCCLCLQDLQAEVDTNKTTYESLNSSGARLTRTMGVSDAQALHRRLEEMNQRWVSLMTKSMEIRYGLYTVWVSMVQALLYVCSRVQGKHTLIFVYINFHRLNENHSLKDM